jgi:hypothetical protein
MTRTVLCFCILLMIFLPKAATIPDASEYILPGLAGNNRSTDLKTDLTAMEALDIVRGKYAANFEKVYNSPKVEADANKDNTYAEYYYKLPSAEYYLTYEGPGAAEQDYLFRLYEFVLDEPDTGIGHTVTYGWYTIDRETGIITDQTAY